MSSNLLPKATKVYAKLTPNYDHPEIQEKCLDEAIQGIKVSVNAFGNKSGRASLTKEEISVLIDARAILKKLQKNIDNDNKPENEKYGL